MAMVFEFGLTLPMESALATRPSPKHKNAAEFGRVCQVLDSALTRFSCLRSSLSAIASTRNTAEITVFFLPFLPIQIFIFVSPNLIFFFSIAYINLIFYPITVAGKFQGATRDPQFTSIGREMANTLTV